MKTTLMILSALLISASALADVRTESFDVQGPRAVELERALIAGGAQTTVALDTSNLSVSNVDCEAGFAEHPGGGQFSSCSLQQTRSPVCRPGQLCSQMMRIVNLSLQGRRATALNVALQDAGVHAQQGRESSRRFVVRISCNNMMGQLGRLSSCRLEVPGGM